MTTTSHGPAAPARNTSLDYLRAFITLLVLAHHSVLAYHPHAPVPSSSFATPPLLWNGFPIVDGKKWAGIDLFVAFNDMSFMALMFFLSGLFVWPSLLRKGSGGFVRDRALRLGAPFVLAAVLIAPLAYYPSYLVSTAAPTISGYARAWLSLGVWPAGPAWFIWVLLAFGCVAGLAYQIWPTWGEALGRLVSGLSTRPSVFFILLVATTAAVYVPMALAFGASAWISVGPFAVQTSRLPFYAAYFFIGSGVGAHGIERGLLAHGGKLTRRWPLWIMVAVAAFVVAIAASIIALIVASRGQAVIVWETLADFGFVLSCAASSFAMLAVFLRFGTSPNAIADSLSRNAYGMYLTHYAFVTWLQWSLLGAALPAPAKGSLVFFGTMALSWSATAALRRIPAFACVP